MTDIPNTNPQTADIRDLNLDLIDVRDRFRGVDEVAAQKLAFDIAKCGLTQFIMVRPVVGGQFKLVIGGHRFRAHQILELQEIRCVVRDLTDEEAHLIEIGENLIRRDLTDSERVRSLGVWNASMKEEHPEFSRGGDRGNQHTGGKVQSSHLGTFSELMAEKTGRSRRSNYDDLALFEALGDDLLKQLSGTCIEDNFSQPTTTSVFVRVAEGANFEVTLANIIGASGPQTGIHALRAAQSEFGLVPRLFDVPGFTSQRVGGARNPVIDALLAFANRNRGWIMADGPNTTREAAVSYAGDWGSPRVFITDPGVVISKNGVNVVRPASSSVTGLICRVDQEEGFHHSPSNHRFNGIVKTARPVEFMMGVRDCEAQYLNDHKIATIIRDNGYRLWGNETVSDDPLTKFLAVQRTQDMIMDSVAAAHKWAIDKPFSVQALLDIAETVNGYLRQLKARGVTLGGKVWIDPTLNTKESWLNGDLFVSYDAEPPAPMQHIIFQFNRNTGYYTELADRAAAEIARLAA